MQSINAGNLAQIKGLFNPKLVKIKGILRTGCEENKGVQFLEEKKKNLRFQPFYKAF